MLMLRLGSTEVETRDRVESSWKDTHTQSKLRVNEDRDVEHVAMITEEPNTNTSTNVRRRNSTLHGSIAGSVP